MSEGDGVKIEILDHGYVQFIERWGTDERIIEAARMSTAKGFLGWGISQHDSGCESFGIPTRSEPCSSCGAKSGDEKLLRYLWEHKHYTPFEMAGLVIEVQAPIFVFREWHRHRTQSFNELSARYTSLPNLFYMPDIDRLRNAKQSKTNRQGSEEGFDHEDIRQIAVSLGEVYGHCRAAYEILLERGVSREVARLVIPVAQYSRMRASANLRNWLAFLSLRLDPTAQWEIRQFAGAVASIIHLAFPMTYSLALADHEKR